jgi:hypothetical protein
VSRSVLSVVAMVGLIVSACAGGSVESSPSGTAPAAPSGDAGTASASPAAIPSLEGIPGTLLATLVADAAERTDTPADEIGAVSGAAVEWSDGSLDCPEPGMGYTQAIVHGYQIVLDAGGTELDYRVGAGDTFVLCQDGRPAPPS